jgi:HlyD family secretion protein
MADRIRGGARRSWSRPLARLTPKVRRIAVIGAVVVVVGGGAAVAWAATRPAGASYRVATAQPSWVVSSLAETGTIQPVTQATVTFPVSGQVSSVTAAVGQQVGVGQTLAQLNTTSLSSQVSSDQSQVATAQAKLATDQASQTAVSQATQTTSPSSAGSSSGSTSRSSGSSSKLNGLVQSLSGDQNAVRAAQQQVDSDLTLVTASVNTVGAQGAACQQLLAALNAASSASSSSKSSTSTASTSGTSTTTAPPTTTTASGGAISYTDCQSAINAALAAETAADKDEHALTSAVAALSTALNNVVAAVGQAAATSSAGSTSSGSGSHSSGSTGSTTAGGGSRTGGSGPASADQIAADQASVDSANAQLAAAQQNLAAATMVSPIAGTVADVTLTPGVNSGSGHVVVIGPGQDEVTTAVNDSQVGQVKPGETATVTPDGATKPITGKVTSVGALASTASSGSASYPVTISLDSTSQQLFDGATASVSITLSTAQAAVTVPTSAITTVGRFSVVEKMVNGTPTPTRVTLGVSGATVTQVTSGLKAGDQVSLANITEPMPTATNSFGGARAFTGGGGGFRGGAGGGAGGGGAGGGGAGGGGAGAGAGAGNAKVVGGG